MATSSPAAATSATVKYTVIGSAKVLTNAAGFALYWFAPDTATTSHCNRSCAHYWPPVKGPVHATGITGTFGTIRRSDGAVQATYDRHPLYTYIGDTTAGEATGNGLNAFGGLWHEVTIAGSPAASPSASSGGGGGY